MEYFPNDKSKPERREEKQNDGSGSIFGYSEKNPYFFPSPSIDDAKKQVHIVK